MTLTILYGMLCAIEVRGFLLARSGQSLLDIPPYWKFAFAVICVWFCWEVFNKEYETSGLIVALFKAGFDGAWFIGLPKMLPDMTGHKILEPPPSWQVALYAILVVVLIMVFYKDKLGSKTRLAMNDRIAALMLALLFATKIGMAFVSGHDAIILKGIGCIAISIGMIEMFLGLLNAASPEESQFPQFPLDASAKQILSAPKGRTMKGKDRTSQEQPLGLRRLARLDQSTGKSWRTQAYPRRGLTGTGNH
jgi:hypothetical protein